MDVEFLDSNGPLFYYRWGKEFGWVWGKKGGRSVDGHPETHSNLAPKVQKRV